MNLAILHYHLNPGGVTRVVANHLASLEAVADRDWRVVVLHGGRQAGWPAEFGRDMRHVGLEVVAVPGLEYDAERAGGGEASPDAAGELAAALRGALAERGMTADDTVLHWHNHSLGKNVAVPGAAERRARDGFATLLEIHDFAEDFRPVNYAVQSRSAADAAIYPRATHVAYALLNRRDLRTLTTAGAPQDSAHLLPNPVAAMDGLPPRDAARAELAARFDVPVMGRFVVYPVRGIRRKNVGEMLLWSALAGENAWFGITLAPLNPAELAFYADWRRTSQNLGLPCRFEVGGEGGLTFAENLAAADAILNTSVTEGFGMVFL